MMTIPELAAALGVSEATARRRVTSGAVRAEKVGKVWIVTDPGIIGAAARKSDFLERAKHQVSETVRIKATEIIRDDRIVLLAERDFSWLFLVKQPANMPKKAPHLVGLTFATDVPMVTCDCEWSRSHPYPEPPCSYVLACMAMVELLTKED